MFEKQFNLITGAVISVALLTCLPLSVAAQPAIQESSVMRTVEVTSDSAIVLESDQAFSELSIANPEIADISTLSGTTLYVLGKKPGSTTLMMIGESGEVMSVIAIRVSPDITQLKRRLSEVLPGEEIEVLTAHDGLVLSGTVSSAEAVTRAVELAGHYAPGGISNLLAIASRAAEPAPVPVVAEEVVPDADPVEIEAQLRQILPDEPIAVHSLGGSIVLSGAVSSPDRAAQALQIAQLIAGPTEVSNLLTVAETRSCNVRTRRGGEIIVTEIPCSPEPTARATEPDAPTAVQVQEEPAAELSDATEPALAFVLQTAQASDADVYPRPRPRRN